MSHSILRVFLLVFNIGGLSVSACAGGYNPALIYNYPNVQWSSLVPDTQNPNVYYVPPPPYGQDTTYIKLTPQQGKFDASLIYINRSNVVLDCNHVVMGKGGGMYSGSAIVVTGDVTPLIKSDNGFSNSNKSVISNIVVRNCIIQGKADAGLRIENAYADNVGIKNNMTVEMIDSINQYIAGLCSIYPVPARNLLRDCVRTKSPSGVLIQNSSFYSNNHGINVGSYVRGLVVEGSSFVTNTVGIHVGYSSDRSKINDSLFQNNGRRFLNGEFVSNQDDSSYREAIVIDSSSHNHIVANEFLNNYGAAVRLYKNCGEQNANGNMGTTREDYSDNNVIEGNSIYLTNSFASPANPDIRSQADLEKSIEKYFVGISVAARQSRDASQWNCSDGYYYSFVNDSGVLVNIARDFSKRNTIQNNTFRNYRMPIRIQDNYNNVLNNSFLKSNRVPAVMPFISVGSYFLQEINEPVRNVIISGSAGEGSNVVNKITCRSSVKINGVDYISPLCVSN